MVCGTNTSTGKIPWKRKNLVLEINPNKQPPMYIRKNSISVPRGVFRKLKGGPDLEKEIHEIIGSKCEDRFYNPLFELILKTCPALFSYLLRHGNLCKGPWILRNFPQKFQKIAGCYECAVYGSRPLIASKPGSSPLERPSLDNSTSQPW